MSLVTSTGGVTLLPLYVKLMLPSSVVIRPLQGEAPTIELVLGYSRSNTSALLKRFLARADQLVARVAKPDAGWPCPRSSARSRKKPGPPAQWLALFCCHCMNSRNSASLSLSLAGTLPLLRRKL